MDKIKEIIWDEYSLDAYICISSGMKFNTPLSKEFFLQRNTAKNCYFTCIDLELVRYIGNLPVWGGSGRSTKLYRFTNIKYKNWNFWENISVPTGNSLHSLLAYIKLKKLININIIINLIKLQQYQNSAVEF